MSLADLVMSAFNSAPEAAPDTATTELDAAEQENTTRLAAVAAARAERLARRQACVAECESLQRAAIGGDREAQARRLELAKTIIEADAALALDDGNLAYLAGEGDELKRQRQVIEAAAEARRREAERAAAFRTVVVAAIKADQQFAAGVRAVEDLLSAHASAVRLAARDGVEVRNRLPVGLALSTHLCGSESLVRWLGSTMSFSYSLMVSASRMEFSDLVGEFVADDAEVEGDDAEHGQEQEK